MSKLPLRPNVCLLICNAENKIFLGERAGSPGVWQLPQGGAEADLSLAENALREAFEELGVDKEMLQVVKQFEARHEYEFDITPEYASGHWRGQSQTFWLLRFSGSDADIQLDRYEQEFTAWKWCTTQEVRELAEEKRRAGYEAALLEFERFATDLKSD